MFASDRSSDRCRTELGKITSSRVTKELHVMRAPLRVILPWVTRCLEDAAQLSDVVSYLRK